jgi:hypothetical protein
MSDDTEEAKVAIIAWISPAGREHNFSWSNIGELFRSLFSLAEKLATKSALPMPKNVSATSNAVPSSIVVGWG